MSKRRSLLFIAVFVLSLLVQTVQALFWPAFYKSFFWWFASIFDLFGLGMGLFFFWLVRKNERQDREWEQEYIEKWEKRG